MITFIGCIRRLAEVTHDDFETQWRETHGPLLAGLGVFTRHVASYTQFHLLDWRRPGVKGDPWRGVDGVAMMSFREIDAFQAAFQEPLFSSVLRADAERFADHERSLQYMTVVDGPEPTAAISHGSISIFEFAGSDVATPLRTWAEGGPQAPKPLSLRRYKGSLMALGGPAGGEANPPPPINITICSFANVDEAKTALIGLAEGSLAPPSGGEQPLHLMARAHVFIKASDT